MTKQLVPPEKKRRRQPDDYVKDGWDDFDENAQAWYKRFSDAVNWGNFDELQRLCDEAGSDQFENLKQEINYELRSSQRRQYTLPVSRKPRYSEYNYGWAPKVRKSNKQDSIERGYSGGTPSGKNMKWAKE